MHSSGELEMEPSGFGLDHLARVVWRRRWIVGLIFAAAIATAAAFVKVEKSVYSAQEKIVVGQGNAMFQAQNGNEIQPFTLTMADLIDSDIVARQVISTLHLPDRPSAL